MGASYVTFQVEKVAHLLLALFTFFALKLSFCYSHGCNRHPPARWDLRSKANAPYSKISFSSHEHFGQF